MRSPTPRGFCTETVPKAWMASGRGVLDCVDDGGKTMPCGADGGARDYCSVWACRRGAELRGDGLTDAGVERLSPAVSAPARAMLGTTSATAHWRPPPRARSGRS